MTRFALRLALAAVAVPSCSGRPPRTPAIPNAEGRPARLRRRPRPAGRATTPRRCSRRRSRRCPPRTPSTPPATTRSERAARADRPQSPPRWVGAPVQGRHAHDDDRHAHHGRTAAADQDKRSTRRGWRASCAKNVNGVDGHAGRRRHSASSARSRRRCSSCSPRWWRSCWRARRLRPPNVCPRTPHPLAAAAAAPRSPPRRARRVAVRASRSRSPRRCARSASAPPTASS